MYIHSDEKLALEYYEFKACKKSRELKKNNEELKKMFFKCKQTLEYIKKIEEYFAKKKNINSNNEKEENNEKITNIIDDNCKDLNNNENIINKEEKEGDDVDQNKIDEEEKNDLKKIEKDYKKHKSFTKNKKYIKELFSNLSEIIQRNKIETDAELNEKPFKDYSKIVSTNEKSKELDMTNNRLNNQIHIIYKNWTFLKEVLIEDKNLDNNGINTSLSENEYIPTMKHSERKINFYRKYNKTLYLSLMIFFIIIDIIIVISETSLIMPVNLSFFSLIFKKMSNPILIHIFCILCASLFFIYASYSFGKIKIKDTSYLIFGENQTNTLSLLSYCQKLSSVSFPISMNIIRMIFYKNGDDSIKTTLEENYSDKIKNESFYEIVHFIPQFLIFVIIIYYYDIYRSIFKKKKISFYIKNENRKQYILEGKEYLMAINKSIFNF